MSERVIDFVDPILSKSAFMRTYTSMIHPIPDKCVWPDFHTQALIPPPLKTLPGRPKVSRRREPNEKPKESRSTCVVCTICKVPGHNKRTCKGSKRVEVASSSQSQVLPPSNTQSQSQLIVDLNL
ncbi:hypothetical protein ACOSQ3_007127 [Xanthoceras sorbifolium]